jgi:flagellar biosynthetic protein FlhB
MLEAISEADVVITNPEHFAVALAYDPSSEDPPKVVAKGSDFIAERIRERAAEEGSSVISVARPGQSTLLHNRIGGFHSGGAV